MSVINQMLRDLDQRGQTPAASTPGHALQQGTHSVGESERWPRRTAPDRRPGQGAWLVGAVVLGGMAVGGAWHLGYLALPGLAAPGAPTPMVAHPAAVSVASPAPAPPTSDSPRLVATANTAVADLPVSLRLEAQLEHAPETAPAIAPAPPAPHPTAAVKPPPKVLTLRAAPAASAPLPAPVPAPAPAAPPEKTPPSPAIPVATAPAIPDAVQQAQRQNAAARDALAQAQALWHAGNASAATELLREAVQVALRASPASAPLDGTQSAMVRELVRMQMGTGHVAEAHALLQHNEARYGAQAELWALRANAAQRLGLHQDSVQSYMQALQTRPNEQRWLLGLAVSLAAMGQTGAANGVVERARAEGPIPREIADYLRQLGVVAK